MSVYSEVLQFSSKLKDKPVSALQFPCAQSKFYEDTVFQVELEEFEWTAQSSDLSLTEHIGVDWTEIADCMSGFLTLLY